MTRRFGLKQFLLFAVLLGSSAATLSLAASGDMKGGALFMMASAGIVMLGTAIGMVTGQVEATISFVLFIAALSHETTKTEWLSTYSRGEVTLRAVDVNKTPILGAELRVLGDCGSANPSTVLKCSSGSVPRTDRNGEIICQQSNAVFSGSSFSLFWCVRVGDANFPLVCKITHSQFTSVVIPYSELFSNPTGEVKEGLPSYETTVVMRSK